MSHFFQKPENALKRAKELMSIPNVDAAVLKRTKRSALEILHDALVAKKHRTWQPMHEELMLLYLDICLELQLGRIAKDGLHQYRNLSIQHNPASLETVILYFVNATQQKLALAKKESNEIIIQAAASVDLEAAQTPEAVMLSTTTFDSSSDRTDREVVVPWLRFTWETYRTVLDILKNNSKLEALYKTVTLRAFDFCVEYTRKIEFRRLCEILRHHLGALQKHSAAPTTQSARQMRAWDGFTLESVESLLEIRYRQLQVATHLELYSEAFRTIDDINTIMSLVDQVPRLDLLVTYYEKLAQIFLVSKNHLFHAYALFKWFALRVAGLHGLDGAAALAAAVPTATVDAAELQRMATRVVLAALSVPLVDFEAAASTPVLDDDATPSSAAQASAQNALSAATREKHARMAALLGYASTPTRAQLLEEVAAAGVLSLARPEVASLFDHVERQEVDPLQLVPTIAPLLQTLRADAGAVFTAYADSVERLVVRRVLFQLTRIYSSVSIAHLKSLFVGLEVSYEEIEQLVVRSRSLSTVAHASVPSLSSLYLKPSGVEASSSSASASSAVAAAAALRTKIRIDHVEQCIRFSDAVELEANPAQLTLLGERLRRVLHKVKPAHEAATVTRAALFEQTRAGLAQSRQEMLARREIIERKKEELERLQQERVKTMERKRQEFEQMRQQLEKERLEAEAKRREMEKKQKIKDEIALKETKQMLDKLGHKDLDNIDLAKVNREQLLQEAKDKAQKAKEDAQRKLRDNARRLDYIIRATREVEQPVLQKLAAAEKETAKATYEQQKADKLKQAKDEHEFGLKEKARLAPALPVVSAFVEGHVVRRKEQYKKASEEQKKKAMVERLERRVANAKARFEEEQARQREIEEEQERQRREEEERRERERQAEVEAELRRQEEEEEKQRLAEEQAKKEAEAEAEAEAARERESRRERDSERDDRFGGAYRPPTRRSEPEDGEWTRVGPRSSAPRSAAPEGRWERAGPPARDSDRGSFRDREGGSGLRRAFGGDREEREGGSGLRRAFGGDRDDREPGSFRRGFGGDRERDDREPGSFRRGFGGDRERDDREPGSFRRGFGGDRERDDREPGSFRRGFGGDREGSSFRRGGEGERERDGGDDRFFSSRREGSYRPPRAGDSRDSRREPSGRAPESGRWR
ncbi:hypothetical protein PINS_up015263 [Pythium insidiosum]|nr:hypothetical protein PINS_up015263 [Pythium insidiosum]